MADFDLKTYLNERRVIVDDALENALPESDDPAGNVVKAMRYSLFAGGKRLRPVLCLLGSEVAGGSVDCAMPAAVAMEMIHTYSLIHDDLPGMDDDDLRRGKPSNHKAFGEGIAILAGDALLTEAFSHLARAGISGSAGPINTMKALNVIAEAAGYKGMVGGQTVDIESEGRNVGKDVVHYIHMHKTAALITAAVVSGAYMAGGDAETVSRLEAYGKATGLAFQIMDDILDIEGDAEELGKPIGSDLQKGKATYPAVFGAAESRKIANDLINQALQELEPFGVEAEPLRAVARYLLVRKK